MRFRCETEHGVDDSDRLVGGGSSDGGRVGHPCDWVASGRPSTVVYNPSSGGLGAKNIARVVVFVEDTISIEVQWSHDGNQYIGLPRVAGRCSF